MDWKEYEKTVTNYLMLQFPEAEVLHNVFLWGKNSKTNRQIDTLVKSSLGEYDLNIVVDAKYHNKKIDVNTANKFIGLLDDVQAHKGILVSKKGFSEAAMNAAENNDRDIDLILLDFDTIQKGNAIIAIPYKGTNGVMLRAPLGWIIEPSPQDFGKTAILYPMGTKENDSLETLGFIYVNFWFKDETASTVEQLNELQKNSIMKLDKKVKFSEETFYNDTIFLRRNSAWNEQGLKQDLLEYTAIIDYDSFLFSLILITPPSFEIRSKQKLLHTLHHSIPIVFDKDPGL